MLKRVQLLTLCGYSDDKPWSWLHDAIIKDIQFKLQNKYNLFGQHSTLRSNVNLLAVASSKGLAFVGNPNNNSFQALLLHNLTDPKTTENSLSIRNVPLPNVPNVMSCNADQSMLAVSYTVNNCGALAIYKVSSFTSSNITSLYNIRLPPHENVYALQLLWNPVNPTSFAVVLSDGAFVVYALNEAGVFEMHSLDKTQNVKCGCWSPKGKQLVLGFQSGTLKQFKPDLTTVKTITCPPIVHPSPFDAIAVHWLSTFQFAVVFLQRLENATPSLYIVNSPKGADPVYICYNDICYSSPGPREHQFIFSHIHQWNLLLVASANGIEIGVLGTKECTEFSSWAHYTLLDEARIEMPLTEDSDETYPIGIAIDTSTMHQLVVGERKLHPMPMVHVLTTHGQLLCFNFLNLMADAVELCSVPKPSINIISDHFRALTEITNSPSEKVTSNNVNEPTTLKQYKQGFQNSSRTSSIPESTDLKASNMLHKNNSWGFGKEKSAGLAELMSTSNSLSSLAQQEFSVKDNRQFNEHKVTEDTKPLYTLLPTFKPSSTRKHVQEETILQEVLKTQEPEIHADTKELSAIVHEIITMHIRTFDKEVNQLTTKCEERIITDDDRYTIKMYYMRLINLEDVIEQANKRDFSLDMQDLQHSFNDAYNMLTECRSKLDMYKSPDGDNLRIVSIDCVSQRQISNLKSYFAVSQALLHQFQDKVDFQWKSYQDLLRRSAKMHIRIPCLDGIFQRLTKFKVLVVKQRSKLNYLKAALKQTDLSFNQIDEVCMNTKSAKSDITLADSVFSINLHHVTNIYFKLPVKKLQVIRDFSRKQRKIPIIKAQRPLRVELTSEVILESKVNDSTYCVDLQRTAVKLIEQRHRKESDAKVERSNAYKLQQAIPEKAAFQVKPRIAFAAAGQPEATCVNFSYDNTSPFAKTTTQSNKLEVGTNQIESEDTNFSKALSFSFMESKAERSKCEVVKETLSAPKTPTPMLFSPKVIDGNVNTNCTTNEYVAKSSHLKPMLSFNSNEASQQAPNKLSISASISNIGINAATPQLKNFGKPDDNDAITISLPTSTIDSRVLRTSLTESQQIRTETRDMVAASTVPAGVPTDDLTDKFIETTICKPTQQTIEFENGSSTNTYGHHEDNDGNGLTPRIPPICTTTTPLATNIFGTIAPKSSQTFISATISSDSGNAFKTSASIVSTPSEFKTTTPNWSPITQTTTSASSTFEMAKIDSVANITFSDISKSEHIKCANPMISKSNPVSSTEAELKAHSFGSAAGTSTFFDENSENFVHINSNPIFEGAAFTSPSSISASNAQTSIFEGSNLTKSRESTNIFCLSAPNNNVSRGSMFGDTTFTKPEVNLFASALYPSKTVSSSASELNFGSSTFGTTSPSSLGTGNYLFGGGTARETSAFTSTSTSVASTNTQPDIVQPLNLFGQGGVSIAHIGFGSSTQQPCSFAKPIFGGTPAFDTPPTFGAQPNFGGVPSFGLPKRFSSFETPSANSSIPFNSEAQKSNIFEALGTTDTGLSFGNLAQATNSPSTSKPAFDGLSFMNYRA